MWRLTGALPTRTRLSKGNVSTLSKSFFIPCVRSYLFCDVTALIFEQGPSHLEEARVVRETSLCSQDPEAEDECSDQVDGFYLRRHVRVQDDDGEDASPAEEGLTLI